MWLPLPPVLFKGVLLQRTSNFQLCEWENRESQANVYNYQLHVREEWDNLSDYIKKRDQITWLLHFLLVVKEVFVIFVVTW